MKFKSLICLVCFSSMMVGCGKQSATDVAVQEEPRVEEVKVLKLEKKEIDRQLRLSTNLEGYETVKITPSVQGKIEHIYVEIGDRVNRGSDLVRMDQTQYNTTKLTYGNLKVELERMKALRETGSVSQQNYDQIKLSYDQTKENLEFLKTNTFVKSPINGVVAAKSYEDGELFTGAPIVVVTQINKLKAILSIPESYFPLINEGMEVEIETEIYPGEKFKGSVEVVYPTIDNSTHNFQVKVVIPNAKERLRPGMFGYTTISLGKVNTIMVPYQTVLKLQGANNRYVFLNKGGYAKRVDVELGQRVDDLQEIISDSIQAGDEIISVGQARLVDGVKLNVNK